MKPQTQKQEVLYLLLKHPGGLTRMDFMNLAYVQNAPEAIRRLRYDDKVAIHRVDTEKTNKFGRTAVIGRYVLTYRQSARDKYIDMLIQNKKS